MPRNLRVGLGGLRWLVVGSVILATLVTLFAAGTVSYLSATRWVEHTVTVRQEAEAWRTALFNAESHARGYLLGGGGPALDAYQATLRTERRQAETVRGLVSDNPVQLANVEAADREAQVVIRGLDELVALTSSSRRDAALARFSAADGDARMDAFRREARQIQNEEEGLLVTRRLAARGRAAFVLAVELLLMVGSAVLLLLAFRRERRHTESVRALAATARERLAALAEIAAHFSDARTRKQVSEVIVANGSALAGADVCTLYVPNETGSVLELIGERGVAPALKDKILRLTESEGNPDIFARMRNGTSVWAENEGDYLALYPELAKMKAEGPRAKAFWGMPLMAEGRAVGFVGMGFYAPRTFDEEERAFIETFARQCAQSLLRATRRQREDEASQWFTTTLRSIGDAVIATDAAGRVIFMNPIGEALTGWTESDARGRPLDEIFCIFSEQTGLPAESPVTKVLREGKVVGLANHTVLRPKRGIEFPIDDSGAPIRNEEGVLSGVVLVFRDATREKRDRTRREFLARAGEALVSSLDHQLILGTVARLAVPALADWCAVDIADSGTKPRQVAVAHVDPLKVQLARELSERYPADPDAPTGVPQVIRTGRSELYSEIPSALLEAGARDPEHLRTIRELRLESAMVVPLRARGRILGAMTFVHAESGRRYDADDLAFAEDFARRAAMAIENALALKATEDARVQEGVLRAEAEIASRAKDEFLATVSHELRTPLNAILGWTVILRRRVPDPAIDSGLAIVERNARAQAKLIEDVLDVSRIISGKLALRLGPTNVREAVAAAIETVTPAAHAKEIAIAFAEDDASLVITADPDRLQQIVWNLLSNAVKFTPKGGQVRVHARRNGSNVCITVADTGEGIRANVLPLVFEPFQQADASTTRRHGGLGLGLAIVRQLVSAHGGTVAAKSDGPGRGSTFIVEVPARSAVPAIGRAGRPSGPLDSEPQDPAQERQERRELRERQEHPRLDGLRLLVVDDEPDARGMLNEVLSECGAEVHATSSAQEALAKFGRIKPHVIVSDIGMPDLDGYGFIGKIRALPEELGGATPAVALTAYARAEDAQRAFAAGYQNHIAKPVEPTELIKVVAGLVGRSADL